MVAIPTPSKTPFQGGSRQGRTPGFAGETGDAGEVTMIPIVPPPPPRPSRVPWLVGFLVVCLVLWGVSVWREQRRASLHSSAQEEMVQDADYYDLAVSSLVHDAQVQFKHWKPGVSRTKLKETLLDRERQLRQELPRASMTEPHRGALTEALDDVSNFVKSQPGDVPPNEAAPVAAAAEGEGTTVAAAAPPSKPIDFSQLKHASGLLNSLPP
jgi:hypothetical protein